MQLHPAAQDRQFSAWRIKPLLPRTCALVAADRMLIANTLGHTFSNFRIHPELGVASSFHGGS